MKDETVELTDKVKSMCEMYGLEKVRKSIHLFALAGELNVNYILMLKELHRVEDLDNSVKR